MKKLLCRILALLMFLSVQAMAEDPGFSNLQTYGGSGEDFAYGAFPLTNRGLVMYGYSRSDDGDLENQKIVNPNHNAWAIGTDGAGAIEWQVVMGEPGMMDDFGSAIGLGDGRYALVHEIYRDENELSEIVILDTKGNVEDTIPLPGGRIRAIAASGERFFALGWRTEDDASKSQGYTHVSYASCLDFSGKVLWEQDFAIEGYEDAYLEYMVPTEGGVIVGGNVHSEDEKRVSLLAKLNEAGEMVWTSPLEKDMGIVIERFIPTEDGGAMVLGESLFGEVPLSRAGLAIRIDADGNVLWDKKFLKGEETYLKGILPVDEGFLVAGQTDAGLGKRWPFAENCWLFMIDNEGEIIAETYISDAWPGKMEILGITKDAQGKLYLIGQALSEATGCDIAVMEIQAPK